MPVRASLVDVVRELLKAAQQEDGEARHALWDAATRVADVAGVTVQDWDVRGAPEPPEDERAAINAEMVRRAEELAARTGRTATSFFAVVRPHVERETQLARALAAAEERCKNLDAMVTMRGDALERLQPTCDDPDCENCGYDLADARNGRPHPPTCQKASARVVVPTDERLALTREEHDLFERGVQAGREAETRARPVLAHGTARETVLLAAPALYPFATVAIDMLAAAMVAASKGEDPLAKVSRSLTDVCVLLTPTKSEPDPIPLFLTCPMCKTRHVDKGAFATKIHHTHSCQNPACGLTWRPAVVPTVGVAHLPGFLDEAGEEPCRVLTEAEARAWADTVFQVWRTEAPATTKIQDAIAAVLLRASRGDFPSEACSAEGKQDGADIGAAAATTEAESA